MFPNLHDYVIAQLAARKGHWPLIAEQSGVPLRTIEKIARREVEDPRVSSIQKLADHLKAMEAGGAPQ